MTATGKPLRRRWFQFNLKALLLLVLVAAIPCSWLKWKMDRRAKERQAVAEVEKFGGTAVYDWEWLSPGTQQPQPPGAAWVRNLLGDDFFTDISEVSLFVAEKEMGDECLAHLDSLTGLTNVSLSRSGVTDEGLAHLTRLPNLEEVYLADTRISDKGLVHLAKLPRLVQLGLWNTDVTDAGLADLKRLPRLQFLYLEGTAVTDAGLVHVRELKGLSNLNVAKTNVTDAGVAELQKALPNCHIHR